MFQSLFHRLKSKFILIWIHFLKFNHIYFNQACKCEVFLPVLSERRNNKAGRHPTWTGSCPVDVSQIRLALLRKRRSRLPWLFHLQSGQELFHHRRICGEQNGQGMAPEVLLHCGSFQSSGETRLRPHAHKPHLGLEGGSIDGIPHHFNRSNGTTQVYDRFRPGHRRFGCLREN